MHECICTFAPSTSKDKETISDYITLYLKRPNIFIPTVMIGYEVVGHFS